MVGPINLGTPEEFTIRELADIVIGMTGSRSKIEYHSLPVDDPKQRLPDISKAKEFLGWQPGVALRDGFTRTIAYVEERLGRENA